MATDRVADNKDILRSMVSALGLVSRLFDAFVDGLEPLFGRFMSKNRLVAVDENGHIAFYGVERGSVTPLGRAPDIPDRQLRLLRKMAAAGPVEARLPAERFIARTINLPAAGRDYIEPIIEHRLERLTPWKPEKVLYGFTTTESSAADGTMTVDFLATSADAVEDALEMLKAYALQPSAIGSAAEPLAKPLRIDLYRGARDVTRRRLRRVTAAVLIGLAATLGPAFLASSVLAYQANQQLVEAEENVLTKRKAVAAAAGAGDAQNRDLQLINAKKGETSVMMLIDRLALLIPDNTYLRELELDGTKLRLVGTSGDAPSLIGILAGDAALAEVRFGAPVTRDEEGRDGFDISASWKSLAPPPASETTSSTVPLDAEVQP